MATDSTELTFVRCPACRSLVPAVSTRCRMCGATLDASLGAESTQPPGSGRVRQKTMTTSGSSEMAEQIGRVREEVVEEYAAPEESPTEAAHDEPAPVQAQASTDPLSGYIDDDHYDDDDFSDEVEDLTEEVPEEMHAEEQAPQEDQMDQIPEPVIISAEESLQKAKEVLTAMGAPEPKREEQKPRVVVEQGKGRFNKGGLSFGAKGSEPSQRRFDVSKGDTKAKPPEVRRDEPSREAKKSREVREEIVETPVARERPAQTSTTKRDTTKHSEALGRLFGWLVNYNEPNGTSIELREGRFFVTSSQLRATDLVLDDNTISTPHAMFTIGLDTGIVIQDLKSDRGVFIRERDASTYRREYDNAVLQHGDWLRFGDLEFLVSIIAHVGVK